MRQWHISSMKLSNRMSQGTVCDKRVGDSQKSADQNLYFFSIYVMCLHFDTFSKTFFTFMWPCIVTNFFLIKPTDALISQIYFCQETLHVSGSSSANHQEFSTVHSALVYVIRPAWHIPVLNVQWKTPDDGQRNCPKHVEFLHKNKFGKLVHGFIKKKFQRHVY